MKTTRLLAIVAVSMIAIGIFTAVPGFSVQPPLDASTYYVGTIGQPVRMDPARAYDTASGALLQNIYQTLIWWDDIKRVSFTPGVGYNLQVSDYANLDDYEPVLCTEEPTTGNGRLIVNSTGSVWRFTINTNAVFHPWTAANGSVMPSRNITAEDVVYSFRRQVVYCSPYAPAWMWMTPAFGFALWRDAYGGPFPMNSAGTFTNTADEIQCGNMISQWCYNIGNDVYFNFSLPWAEGVLRQIFAQTWGGVVNPDWVKEMGGWDGNFAANWTANYHWKPTSSRSELDTYKSEAAYPGHGSKYAAYARGAIGTGPYLFTSWDTVNKVVRMDKYDNYWKGWTAAGDGAGNYLSTVIWKGIDAYPTRKMLFLEGEFDVCVIPTANMFDLLVGDAYTPIAGINLVYNVAGLQNDVLLFGFNVSDASPYQAYVGYPTHIGGAEPYFYNNTHMRRAFAWALNFTSYIADAWFGEALPQRSWWVDGLSPAEYKNENSSMPLRNLDYAEMQAELNQAIINGQNISQVGFEATMVYNIGNDQRKIACDLIAQAFATLNAKYKVTVIGVDWPVFLDAQNNGYLPLYDVGWLADFADPDNFCEPYQASWGAFLYSQGPPYPEDQAYVDTLIMDAMIEPDYNTRKQMYMDLQYLYWLDVPSFTLVQPVGRRWARDWVQGWYYNSLLPGLFAYNQLWKATPTAPQPINLDITSTVTPLTTYEVVYISDLGQMKVLYGGGVNASMTFSVSVDRIDSNTLVPSLAAVVGLERDNTTDLAAVLPVVVPSHPQYPTSTLVLIGPSSTWTGTLTWWEDGLTSTLQANATWEIFGRANVRTGEAYDTDSVNNRITSGFDTLALANSAAGAFVLATGDINADAIVNILDAIQLANSFGRSRGQPNFNENADINSDNTVNILDAILLSNNFNFKAIVYP